MPRNGSGTYSAPSNSWNPAVPSTLVDTSDWQDLLDDLESAISASIAKDGQTVTTAVIPFAQGIKSNTIAELTSAAGVTIDGVLLKDGGITADGVVDFSSATVSIGALTLESLTLNTPLGISSGGTGAGSAGSARTSLGLAIGTDVQAFDADLSALAALSTTGMMARTAAATYAMRTITAGNGIAPITNGDGVSGNPTIAADFADKAAMEAASSAVKVVAPSVVQNHPGVAKAWGKLTMSAGTPTLGVNYNVTSITDSGEGLVAVTIATDFSSANYAIIATARATDTTSSGAVTVHTQSASGPAAGSFVLQMMAEDGNLTDDWTEIYFACFGDQ